MNQRKLLLFRGIILLLCICVAGCKAAALPERKEKLVKQETRVTVMRYEHPYQVIRDQVPVIQKIKEWTNVQLHFEAVPLTNYEDKKKIALATRNFPDIILINRQNLLEFSATRALLPLNDLIEEHAPHFKAMMERYPDIQKLTIGGNLYGFPIMRRNEEQGIMETAVPAIRTDVLNRHRIMAPRSFDELAEVLKELKRLYPQSVPWATRFGTRHLLQTVAFPLGSGFGTDGLYYEPGAQGTEGKFIFGPTASSFTEVIRYLNDLYRSGIIDPDYMVATSQQWEHQLETGRSFFSYDEAGMFINIEDTLRESVPDAELHVITVPGNASGQRRSLAAPLHLWDEQYAINAKTDNPEMIVRLLDWLYSEQGADLTNLGIPDKHYTIEDKQYVMNPEIRQKYEDRQFPYLTMQGELGIGRYMFSTLLDDRPLAEWADHRYTSMVHTIGQDAAYLTPVLEPPLTQIEADKVQEIKARLEPILIPGLEQFIIGTRPLEQYGEFRQQLIDAGAVYMENIYNHAMNRYLQAQAN